MGSSNNDGDNNDDDDTEDKSPRETESDADCLIFNHSEKSPTLGSARHFGSIEHSATLAFELITVWVLITHSYRKIDFFLTLPPLPLLFTIPFFEREKN